MTSRHLLGCFMLLFPLMGALGAAGCAQETPPPDVEATPEAPTVAPAPEIVEEPAPEEDVNAIPATPTPAPEPTEADQPSLEMTRSATAYEPGGAVEVTVTLDYDGEEPITAFAIEETLPPGWRFGIVSDGELPAISPDAGETETFALVWINIPEWPMTVHYIIDAPDDAAGEYSLTGQAVYRKLGGELRTPMLTTALFPAE